MMYTLYLRAQAKIFLILTGGDSANNKNTLFIQIKESFHRFAGYIIIDLIL